MTTTAELLKAARDGFQNDRYGETALREMRAESPLGLRRSVIDVPLVQRDLYPYVLETIPSMAEWAAVHGEEYGVEWLHKGGAMEIPAMFFANWVDTSAIVQWYHTTRVWYRFAQQVEYAPHLRLFRTLSHAASDFATANMTMEGQIEHRRKTFMQIVHAHRAMLDFDMGVEGFEVFYDTTTGTNDRGHSFYTRDYIDGMIAFRVAYQGVPALTISFTPSDRGVMIQQIQCVKRPGERWLKWPSKLPKHYFDHVIDRLHAAFHPQGMPVNLIGGEAAALAVRQSYGKCPDNWEVTSERIVATYDRPLTGFERDRIVQFESKKFHRLKAA